MHSARLSWFDVDLASVCCFVHLFQFIVVAACIAAAVVVAVVVIAVVCAATKEIKCHLVIGQSTTSDLWLS